MIYTQHSGSSLRIDNLENSLYMGTVQGYIQGLEQGAINKNCTFITIQASPTTFSWEDNKPTLTRMVTYKAPNGKYYTTETKIQGAIYGTGPKIEITKVYEGTSAFEKYKELIYIEVDFRGLLGYMGEAKNVKFFRYLTEDHGLIAITIAFMYGDIGEITENIIGEGWEWAVTAGKEKTLSFLGKMMNASKAQIVLAVLRVGLVGFMCACIAYGLSQYFGLPEMACLINAVAGFAIGVGIALVSGLTFFTMGCTTLFGVSLTLIGAFCIVAGVIIILAVIYYWSTHS